MSNFILNKSFVLRDYITSFDLLEKNLGTQSSLFDTNAAPPEGDILTKNLYASLDAYQLGRMRGSSDLRCVIRPFGIGETIENFSVAKVIISDNAKSQKDDLVVGLLPVEEYSRVSRERVENMLSPLDNPSGLNLEYFLGPLGMPGLAAHASFYNIGKPVAGGTICISTAAGAVGQVVGQLAKREGLKVIGSVGDARKLKFITDELGFDGGFIYREESTKEALTRLAPDGIDIYFDSVGGEQLEAALAAMKRSGRINKCALSCLLLFKRCAHSILPVGCGMISTYRDPANEPGVKSLMNVVMKGLTYQGFDIIQDFTELEHKLACQNTIRSQLEKGAWKVLTNISEGIDAAPGGYASLYSGENFGKSVVKIVV